MRDLRILAFDTSGPHLSASVLVDDVIVARHHVEMAKGQAEALLPFLEARLNEADLCWRGLTHLAVGIGPGNFTGIRISVAASRGLALSLGIPAIGVSNFEIVHDPDFGIGSGPAELVSLRAPRDHAYIQKLRYGSADDRARIIDPSVPPSDLAQVNLQVIGYRAHEIAAPFSAPAMSAIVEDHARRIAQVTGWRIRQGHASSPRPAPLYVRPADAAPAADPPPVILP